MPAEDTFRSSLSTGEALGASLVTCIVLPIAIARNLEMLSSKLQTGGTSRAANSGDARPFSFLPLAGFLLSDRGLSRL